MTITITVTTETAETITVETYVATPDTYAEVREQIRQSAPYGSTQTIADK